jgi:two-component system, sensor histidine kinase SagS
MATPVRFSEPGIEQILSALPKGVALLDHDFRVTWANPMLVAWCAVAPIDRTLEEIFGSFSITCSEHPDLYTTLTGRSLSFRLHSNNHFFDVSLSPIKNGDSFSQIIALVDDTTETVVRQQKLDALHQAGQELADLDPESLLEMDVPSRVELLKENLRRHIHDLLHYDVIEVRLLDPESGRLEPLLEEGMTDEASSRILYAGLDGNGVTGYVAAIGKSYLCQDTANDPHYIEGASGARCSMTVPIIHQDEVIGTLNVESPRVNAFSDDDLQFAELFSRELARALHTLNLLSAQQNCTVTQSIEAVSREVALPADELMNLGAELLLKEGSESEVGESLRKIMMNARQIKSGIRRVGQGLSGHDLLASRDPRTELLRAMRILVIDSEEHVRRGAHQLLERQGCEVETAITASHGLAMARVGEYDAVLTDIRHPDMRGTIVYRTLRQILPAARIVLTQAFGYDSEHTVVNARQDGYWLPVIFKPFRNEQLLNALTCTPPPAVSSARTTEPVRTTA